MATHSSILAWKIPWMEEPGRLQSMVSQRVRHDWATSLSLHFVVQSLIRVWLFATPWTAASQAFLSFTISWSLLRLMSIELMMPFNRLIHCCPLLFLPSIFPRIRVFSNEWLFTSSDQSIGASASASVLLMNIQGWFPLGLTGLISVQSKGLPRAFSNTTVWKHRFFSTQPYLWSNYHIRTMTTGKTMALTSWEGLGAGGEGDDKGWDGWMASLTRWTWV